MGAFQKSHSSAAKRQALFISAATALALIPGFTAAEDSGKAAPASAVEINTAAQPVRTLGPAPAAVLTSKSLSDAPAQAARVFSTLPRQLSDASAQRAPAALDRGQMVTPVSYTVAASEIGGQQIAFATESVPALAPAPAANGPSDPPDPAANLPDPTLPLVTAHDVGIHPTPPSAYIYGAPKVVGSDGSSANGPAAPAAVYAEQGPAADPPNSGSATDQPVATQHQEPGAAAPTPAPDAPPQNSVQISPPSPPTPPADTGAPPSATTADPASAPVVATPAPINGASNAPGEPEPASQRRNGPQPPIAPASENVDIPTGVPAGFESDEAVATVFDVYFQGDDMGSFEGRLSNGVFRFTNPSAVTTALGNKVNGAAALRLLAESLSSNESLRCVGDQKDNCGLLPAGISGVIVNPETFRVDVFLGREFLIEAKAGPQVLPNPISGPSLIQNVLFTTSTDLTQHGAAHLGATFNTDASWGRTALISQISGDDITGFQLQQGFVQHVRSGWMGSAGLLTSQNQSTLTNFRFYGADISSYQTSTIYNPNQGTPISLVLPRHVRVELYANGTLVSAREYDGGLQTIDTGSLPTGSYSVRIVARDGATIVLDTTRPFTKAGALPPPGKFLFDFSAGERVADFFNAPTGLTPLTTGAGKAVFLPQTTGELVVRGQVAHRLGASSALTADVTLVGKNVYPELTFQTFKGPFSALVGGSADTHGDYSILASGNALFHNIALSFSGRYTNADFATAEAATALAAGKQLYLPYSQTGYDLFSSVTVPVFKGTLSLTASYDHITTTPVTPDTYTYGVEYDLPIKTTVFGTDGLFSLYGNWSDDEKLIGVKFTFFRTLGPHTGLSYDVGAEYAKGSDPASVKTGAAPVADVELEQNGTLGPVDLDATLSGSTDSQQHSVELQTQAASPWGTAQLTAGYQDNLVGGTSAPLTLDLQTGFVIGGGQIKIGLPTTGPAMLLGVIDRPPKTLAPAAAPTTDTTSDATPQTPGAARAKATNVAAQTVAAGSYRIVLDGQPYSLIDVGQKVAVPLQPYKDYNVSLQPVGAPPYDFDLTARDIPVYPGNVIVLHWKARHVATVYGHLVDTSGLALANARVDIGTDTTVTDAEGYFVVTGPDDANIVARTEAGEGCKPIPLANLKATAGAAGLLKLGDVVCRVK